MFFALEESRQHRIIYLTEAQLQMILEAVSVDDIYQKYYSTIPRDVFDQIVQADPTYRQNKMGKYGKWMLKMYGTGRLNPNDLGRISQALQVFTDYSRRINPNDINRYTSMDQLYNAVQPFVQGDVPTSRQDAERKAKAEGADIIFDNPQWEIVIPKTWEAAKLYGANTRWCTSSRESDSSFKQYTGQGPLYINIDKRNNVKYQFHFESEQFMDDEDYSIEQPIIDTIDMPKEVVEFYQKRLSKSDFVKLYFPPKGSEMVYEGEYNGEYYKMYMVPNKNGVYALFQNERQVSPYIYPLDSTYNRFESTYFVIGNMDDLMDLYLYYPNGFQLYENDLFSVADETSVVGRDNYYAYGGETILFLFKDEHTVEIINYDYRIKLIEEDHVEKISKAESWVYTFKKTDNTWTICFLYDDNMSEIVTGVYPYNTEEPEFTEIDLGDDYTENLMPVVDSNTRQILYISDNGEVYKNLEDVP